MKNKEKGNHGNKNDARTSTTTHAELRSLVLAPVTWSRCCYEAIYKAAAGSICGGKERLIGVESTGGPPATASPLATEVRGCPRGLIPGNNDCFGRSAAGAGCPRAF